MSDAKIANSVRLKHIDEIASSLSIHSDHLHQYGKYIAKIDRNSIFNDKKGKLVLVTAVSPTSAGEGKTTTSIGLADALNRLGKKAVLALREPSLGPCFGIKGGATGGGKSQIAPSNPTNLHFTGDLHAISAATNLLASMIDNHIYHGNKLGLDPAKIYWRRAIDVNDRSLRQLNYKIRKHEINAGFDITAASETMAIFCLSRDLDDLQQRIGNIIIAGDYDGNPITARDLKADGAMSILLKDALMPNLVQTLEGNPAFVHGGPFANIAHGCNSLIATNAALSTGEIAITEAGFGADMGGEKFCNIACRYGGFAPDACVIVASVRSVKLNGGNGNLLRHIENMQKFGLPVVVAINKFPDDSPEDLANIERDCQNKGVKAITCTHWADGGSGAENLADEVINLIDSGNCEFKYLYQNDLPLTEKITKIAKEIYRAGEIEISPQALEKLQKWQNQGFGDLPVCMAKNPSSFTIDPKITGAPEDHKFKISSVRLYAGAKFITALCGNVMTMPGLPETPAACNINIDSVVE